MIQAQAQASAPRLVTAAASLGVLYVFRSVLWPLALALVLAIFIGIAARRITKLLPRAGKGTILVATASLVGALVIAAMVTLVSGFTQILMQAPTVYHRLDQLVGDLQIPWLGDFSLDQLVRRLDTDALARSVASSLRAAGGGLLLTVLYLFSLISCGPLIGNRLRKIIASHSSDTLVQVLKRSIDGVEAYIYIQTITGLMMAVVAFIVMLAVGLKGALFWALTFFLLSYLPVVGVMVGSVGPTLFALIQFPTAYPAAVVLCGIQVISFIIGNFVLPKMQAKSQNIDPTASLVAIGAWTILWGIPGAFLAIPLTLALMYALAQYDSVRWIAVLMSNDGSPIPAPLDERAALVD